MICAAVIAQAANADLITLQLDDTGVILSTTNVVNDTYQFTATGQSVSGVTFDATITALGSTSLGILTTGLGVDNTRVNDGEWVRLTASISNVMGGLVSFDGFSSVDMGFFAVASDEIAVSSSSTGVPALFDDFSSDPGTFFSGGVAMLAPNDIFLVGETSTSTTSVSFDSVVGEFSAVAAVPEPGSMAFLGLLTAGLCFRQFRRRRKSA